MALAPPFGGVLVFAAGLRALRARAVAVAFGLVSPVDLRPATRHLPIEAASAALDRRLARQREAR